MRPGKKRMGYTIQLAETTIVVEIVSDGLRFRVGDVTEYLLDGEPSSGVIFRPNDGKVHHMLIRL